MENEKNKRAGIGQKPRGSQQTRGVEALPNEKPVASNEGQEEGVKDPVSEPADRVQEGGGLLEEISTISDKTAENEKMPSVSVSEGESLEEMLAKSEDAPTCPSCGQKYDWNAGVNAFEHDNPCTMSKQENPVMGGLRRATPEEEEAFRQQTVIRTVRPFTAEELATLDDLPAGKITLRSELGEQPDGSFNVILRLEEGYIEAVRQWAEAEGLSVEEWVARQFSHYLETWGQPAKSR